MLIIVGLGNPGKRYQKTRHNLGFRVVDALRKEGGFPAFRLSTKFNALLSEGEIDGQKALLVKPQTFMNGSGMAVKKIIGNCPPVGGLEIGNSLMVVHDDIGLPLGTIKISQGRGPGGHKGVESIIKTLKTKDFARFRMGIKTAHLVAKIKENVLKRFTNAEEKVIKGTVDKTISAIKLAAEQGLEKAMNEYN